MEGSQAVPAQTKASATPVVESRDPSAEAAAISNEATGIGLKGRLQLAFGAITLFVVIAAGVGLYAFFEVGKSLEQITEKALPPALTAGELLTKAEYIVAAGPALLASNNADDINRHSASALAELANAATLLDRLQRADLDPAVVEAIREDISSLNGNLALLAKNGFGESVGRDETQQAGRRDFFGTSRIRSHLGAALCRPAEQDLAAAAHPHFAERVGAGTPRPVGQSGSGHRGIAAP